MSADDELTDDERTRYSLVGFMRFDARAIANVLRTRSLAPNEARLLANLLEGKNSQGLRLEMRGQGKGWKPIFEKAEAGRRIMAMGAHVDAQLAGGSTVEQAVIDTAAVFHVSEPTVYRDLRLYRAGKEAGL